MPALAFSASTARAKAAVGCSSARNCQPRAGRLAQAAAAPPCAVSASRREAQTVDTQQQQQRFDRRELLLSAAAAVAGLAAAPSARALCVDQDTDEAGAACRRAELDRTQSTTGSYGDVTGRKFGTALGVPVSELNDEYTRATRALGDEIQRYATINVYDKSRPALLRSLKQDCTSWVSKYARGGSVRKQSARKMYIASDAIMGHMASAGLAPFPPSKLKVVLSTLKEAEEFLADGR